MEASGFGQGGGDAGDAGQGEAFDGGAGAYEGADVGGEFYDDGQGYDYGDQYGGGYGGGYGAPAADPAATANALQGVIGQAVQQHVAPLQAQLAQQQMERGAADLVSQHPELGEQANAEALMETVHQAAQQIGDPRLAQNTRFWGLVHNAMKQAEAAHAEQERQSADPGDQIVGWARDKGRAALPFQ